MVHGLRDWLVPLALIMVITGSTLPSMEAQNKKLKTATYISPMISLAPGEATNRNFYNSGFPKGHVAIKTFKAEIIDEQGNPIPFTDLFLHHTAVVRYLQHVDVPEPNYTIPYTELLKQPGYISDGSLGPCQPFIQAQIYGLGSELRKTAPFIDDPYGIENGNPADIPPNYEQRWDVNVHAIDTREVENKVRCTECWCDAYNVTVDELGIPLDPGYLGGFKCCYDNTRCKLKQSYNGDLGKRHFFLRHTWTYQDWEDYMIPVRIYLLDITDSWTPANPNAEHSCAVEYSVEACYSTNQDDDTCFARRRVRLTIPKGGYFVYGAIHQHAGGVGGSLFAEDGRLLCTSTPIYGKGDEVGNEKGYVIGMTSCHPKPGSMIIKTGEVLTFESLYAEGETHRGVMGTFNVWVADSLPTKPVLQQFGETK